MDYRTKTAMDSTSIPRYRWSVFSEYLEKRNGLSETLATWGERLWGEAVGGWSDG